MFLNTLFLFLFYIQEERTAVPGWLGIALEAFVRSLWEYPALKNWASRSQLVPKVGLLLFSSFYLSLLYLTDSSLLWAIEKSPNRIFHVTGYCVL